MKSVAEQIEVEAEAIMVDLQALMALSHVEPSPKRVIFGMGVVDATGDHRWVELSPEGKTLQGKLHIAYDKFSKHVEVLLFGQTESLLGRYRKATSRVKWAINQSNRVNMHSTSVQELLPSVVAALREHADIVSRLYSSTGMPIFIPDTNAIYYNISIEDWHSLYPAGFTICLVPTVISEIDRHKTEHRVDGVRKKAETFTRKISEYRRRGSLLTGVPLAGKMRVMAVATEPREGGFDWLDLSQADDRIIASTLEIMRANTQSSVVIVTRDAGMHNKCELGGLTCVEPPDPSP
jgi:hypothetical protein